MKTIDDLLTSEQRAVLECAEGIVIREMESRLIASRETDPRLGFNSGAQRPSAVHKPNDLR